MTRTWLSTGFAFVLMGIASRPALAQAPPAEPAPVEQTRPAIPESGVGLMTGGSYMLVGGTALLVTLGYVTAREPDMAPAMFGSAVMMAAGATFIWLGDRRARGLRAWSERNGLRPPPDGRALLISGLVVGGGGLMSMLAYGVLSLGYCTTQCFNPNTGAWFGTAGAVVGAGLGMMTGGLVLRSRNRVWRAKSELGHARLAPSFAFSPRGAHFGVALRF